MGSQTKLIMRAHCLISAWQQHCSFYHANFDTLHIISEWKTVVFIRSLWQYKKHSVKRHQENHIGESRVRWAEVRRYSDFRNWDAGAVTDKWRFYWHTHKLPFGNWGKASKLSLFVVLFLHSEAEIRWVTWLSASWLTDITTACTAHHFHVQNELNTCPTALLFWSSAFLVFFSHKSREKILCKHLTSQIKQLDYAGGSCIILY